MAAPAPSGGSGASVALVDAHVHLWSCFEPAALLDAASAAFDRAQRRLGDRELGGAGPAARVLLLMATERVAESATPPLARLVAVGSGPAGWRFEPTSESGSLCARRGDEPPIWLIEGRQVETAERLEVLASPCPARLPSGAPLAATLTAVLEHDAVPILPWGFGKWMGARGRALAGLLDSSWRGRILLCDNGGRPRGTGKSRLLTLGAQRGVPVLCGSDPLPLPAEAARAGSYGSILRGPVDPGRPAASVRSMLGRLEATPGSFGRRVGLGRCLATQLRLRLPGRRA